VVDQNATAQWSTLTSLHPHTLSMDKHLTLRCGLHIFFDDAYPSNATLYRGHKYTLTLFFSSNNMVNEPYLIFGT
jgi:hypothetical protein